MLDLLNRDLAATKPEYDAYVSAVANLRARRKATLQLLSATDDALARWAFVHKGLLTAIRQRQPVSVDALADSVTEVRSIIKKVREL